MPLAPRSLDERDLVLGIEEQLRDEEVDAGLGLLYEVEKVLALFGGVDMPFWIAGTREAEVISWPTEATELLSVAEAIGGSHELPLAARRRPVGGGHSRSRGRAARRGWSRCRWRCAR